jgi:xanthine dehydrogenase accessory factor
VKSFEKSFWEAANELHQTGLPFITITLVGTRGHVSQELGCKMLVNQEGTYWGTIGGGKIEMRTLEECKKIFEKLPALQGPTQHTWELQRDLGMTCGGEATVLFETHQRADGWNIVVFGAGHVGQALIRVLNTLDCNVACVDFRSEWVDKLPNSPKVKKVCIPDMKEYLNECSANDYFVCMTRGHVTDLEMLEAIFKKFPDARYIGSLGSDVKAKKLRSDLQEKGIAPALLEKMFCPIGLELGKNDPAEIAISVAAELLQQRDRD